MQTLILLMMALKYFNLALKEVYESLRDSSRVPLSLKKSQQTLFLPLLIHTMTHMPFWMQA